MLLTFIQNISMKILSILLLSGIILTNSANCQNSIQSSINALVANNSFANASISFEVIDLETGKSVASYDANRSLPTASIAKLFSTATALEIAGPSYQAQTRLYIDGPVDSSGVLHGNVWIRGGGDPSLGSKYFFADNPKKFLQDWQQALSARGIERIQGSVIADASDFGYEPIPDGWNWSDLGNYYGAGPSGLTIYDNLVEFDFKVPSVGQTTQLNSVTPEVPGLVFHNYIVASSKQGDNSYLYGGPYNLDRYGTGTLPAGKSSFIVKGSLPDPELQCAHELASLLTNSDIVVVNGIQTKRQLKRSEFPAYDKYELIHTTKGIKLLEIIRETNYRSINLFAEHMVSTSGFVKSGNGTYSDALAIVQNHWENRIESTGLYINDGSGLSRSNGFSAHHFTELLRYMSHSKYSNEYFSSLPVAGESGTLKSVCNGQAAEGRMHAKSGSMNRIRSYAGYIDSAKGKRYAFALITNNFNCSSSQAKHLMEKVFNAIANY